MSDDSFSKKQASGQKLKKLLEGYDAGNPVAIEELNKLRMQFKWMSKKFS